MWAHNSTTEDRPNLRIWTADNDTTWPVSETPAPNETASAAGSDNGLHPAMSLSAFYRAYVEPVYLVGGGSRTRNTQQYRESVAMWSAYTGNPSIEAIDETTCVEFLRGLRTRRGRKGRDLAANTIKKHCSPVQKVLDMAGPKCRANADAATRRGLFGMDEDGCPREAPLIPRVKTEHRLPCGGWTLREISHWLDCAQQWRRPSTLRGIEPCVFWPALITFIYNTGLRIKPALHVRRDMIRRGYLIVPRELMKRRRDHRVWLNRHARAAVERLTTVDPKIVPRHCKTGYFYKVFRDQFAVVFSAERREEIDKPFHGLRARMLSILWEKAPGVAKMVAAHKDDVTLDYYVDRTPMRKALEKLPQPKRRKRDVDDPQRTFDWES